MVTLLIILSACLIVSLGGNVWQYRINVLLIVRCAKLLKETVEKSEATVREVVDRAQDAFDSYHKAAKQAVLIAGASSLAIGFFLGKLGIGKQAFTKASRK
jgi:hypothetical protein